MTNYCKIETIIVIPTYNIGDEFLFNDYNFFLKNNENVFLCFVLFLSQSGNDFLVKEEKDKNINLFHQVK